jgi:hypothetical protein
VLSRGTEQNELVVGRRRRHEFTRDHLSDIMLKFPTFASLFQEDFLVCCKHCRNQTRDEGSQFCRQDQSSSWLHDMAAYTRIYPCTITLTNILDSQTQEVWKTTDCWVCFILDVTWSRHFYRSLGSSSIELLLQTLCVSNLFINDFYVTCLVSQQHYSYVLFWCGKNINKLTIASTYCVLPLHHFQE